MANIVDFANQIKDYMRSAEVVEGKNHAYSQENNAVIATIENGKSYKVRWTGSATVTLKKNSASGTEVTSGSTSPLSFTADSDFDLYFGSSADVTEIMVYDGNDTSDTYEPYYVPLKDSKLDIADQQVLGAWNLLENKGTTQTINGATFTKNDDNTVTVNVAGSAVSATAKYILSSTTDIYVPLPENIKPGNTYYFSGCEGGSSIEDGGIDTFFLWINFRDSNNIYINHIIPTNGEKKFIVPSNASLWEVGINIFSSAGKLTNKVFKPMISIKPNQPYVPYVMTNRELTGGIVPLINNVSELLNVSFRFVLLNQAKTKLTIKNAKNQTILLFVFGQYGGRKQGLFAISRMFDDSISVTPYFNDGIVIDTNMILENVGTNDLDIKFPTFSYGAMGYGIFVAPSINSSIETGTYT